LRASARFVNAPSIQSQFGLIFSRYSTVAVCSPSVSVLVFVSASISASVSAMDAARSVS